MSNNHENQEYDFENICRTCLSTENLKPLYEKCYQLTCLIDMLMSCTLIKVSVVIFKILKVMKQIYKYLGIILVLDPICRVKFCLYFCRVDRSRF